MDSLTVNIMYSQSTKYIYVYLEYHSACPLECVPSPESQGGLTHRVHTYLYKRWNRVSVSAHSAGAYTATLLVMVNVIKGGGRAPPTLTSPANFTLMTECTPESRRYYSAYTLRAHSPAGEGVGKSQFERLEKKPIVLCLLCDSKKSIFTEFLVTIV